MPRLPRLAKRLGLSLGSLVVAVAATELVVRATEPGPYSLFDRNPYVDSEVDDHVRHRPDFVGRWDGTWYVTDRRGFRGPEREPTFAEDELRVACVGDSCTFGKGVLEEACWPRQLEARLREGGRNAVVFNLGINGGRGKVYRALLDEHADELKPNVIALGYNINDFPNTIKAVDERVYKDRSLRRLIPEGLRNAFGRLALYRKLRQVYYDARKERDWAAAEATARETADEPIDSAVWEKERGYLEAIGAHAERHGARVVVFLFPYESQVFLESYDATPIERLRELCGSLGMPFVDLATEFRAAARSTEPPTQLFLAGDRYHPNALGYGIVADRVLAAIERE
ncbi:MAG: SGNH/GDSL hydrolase family protein [Planctomycetota bacterium]